MAASSAIPATGASGIVPVAARSAAPGIRGVSRTAQSPPVRTTLRVTREGLISLAVALLLWLIGLYKGINLLTLLASVLLVLWVFNLLLAGRRLASLRASLRCRGQVFARTPCRVDVEVVNPGRRMQLGVRLESSGSVHALTRFVPVLAPGQSQHWQCRLVIPHRGRYSWGQLRLVSRYPHGLFERAVILTDQEDTIVFPQLGRLHRGRLKRWLARMAAVPEAGRGLKTRRPTAQTEFHGLRTFRPGDSPRWIHWRTTARRNEVMVREFEEPPSNNLVLVLDPWVGVSRSPGKQATALAALLPQIEEALSLAATICWEWCKETGHALLLAVAGREPIILEGSSGKELAHRFLECLALVPAEPESHAAALVAALTRRLLPSAPVIVIGSNPEPLADALAGQLRRRVASLDASSGCAHDFYERVSRHAP